MSDNIQHELIYEIIIFLKPLHTVADDGRVSNRVFSALGWDLASALPPAKLAALEAAITELADLIEALLDLAIEEPRTIADLLPLLEDTAEATASVAQLIEAFQWETRPAELDALEALPGEVIIVLAETYLRAMQPVAYGVLAVLGLVTPEGQGPERPAVVVTGVTVRQPTRVAELRFERLTTLLTDPVQALSDDFAGAATAPSEVGDRLFPRLATLLKALGCQSHFDATTHELSIDLPIGGAGTAATLTLEMVDGPGGRFGLSVTPTGSIEWSLVGGDWTVTLGLAASSTFVVGPGGVSYTGALPSGSIRLASNRPAGSPLLIGSADGTRLELGPLAVGGAIAPQVDPVQSEYSIEIDVGRSRFVISLSDVDSFVGDSMGTAEIASEFAFNFQWSNLRGVRFDGSAGIEICLPVSIELGPLRITEVLLRIVVDAQHTGVEGAISASLTLGPVSASVDRIGLAADLRYQQGNLGPLDLSPRFRPPSGVGLLVDAGPVSGGGYLAFYPEIGRYTGVAQLDVVGIAVRAIGIVDTILPGGEEGFSFLVLITAEFTPIQLGMGFTLNGIGGLAGIHRTLMTEPLRTGIREGTLDDILFPEDPVRDATALIARLQSIFPVKKDEYVFGVMVKLGYGTPSLVTAEIGLILKVPDPIIVLLGSISAKLPTEDAAVIDLNLDVLGILDFGQKLFSLDASLRDSRIAIFNISGDMALRLGWGDPPSFALSIGGLHPAFQPPPGFPTLRRVSISVGNGDNPRLGFEAYIALTSNSLQFGARVFLYAEAGGFSIEGYLGFDALIIFVPFSFRFDFAAGLIIKAGGTTLLSITVEGMLEGPTPWHVRGRASFCILFFEISVDFDARFGEEQRNTLPGVARDDLLGQVRDAFQDAGNWSAALPEGEPSFVSFLEAPVPEGVVRIDPIGTLTARQKVAPLNRALSKVGESRVEDGPMTIGVPSTWLGGVSNASPDTVLEYFAPAQVEDLDDAAKLSRPSFEQMDGGVSFGVDEIAIGPGQTKDMEFETVRTDGAPPAFLYSPSVVTMLSQVRRGARPKATATQSGLGKFAPAKGTSPLVAWRGDGEYVIASVDTLARRNDILATPTTQGAASSRLASYLAANPSDRGTVAVVPLHEAA